MFGASSLRDVKWVDDMNEQGRMTTTENRKLDVQHQDITHYEEFI